MTRLGRGRTKGRAGLAGFLGAGALLIAVPAMASDADLQKRVENRLARAGLEERGNVQASVKDGVVTLEGFTLTVDARRDAERDGVVLLQGSVRQPWLKDAFDRRIAELGGVRDIRNEIRIAPTSIFDDRLRVQLYRRIYGDDMFVRYSNWANPPIRIGVENGKVTLTGVVNSRVEQVKLGMIARGTLAFRVDNQVEVESERPKEPVQKTTQS
jgi:osmotically-inducible protein OsmY